MTLEGEVWRVAVPCRPTSPAPISYGFRIDGRWAPLAGDRFDPTKVLLDPYASAAWFPTWGRPRPRSAPRGRSRSGRSPLGVLVPSPANGDGSAGPRLLPDQLVIQELHVRGFTKHPSSGVQSGASGHVRRADRQARPPGEPRHHRHRTDARAPERSRRGFVLGVHAAGVPWRSSPATPRVTTPAAELAELAAACHRHRMELVVDVVYNHTTRGGPDRSDLLAAGASTAGPTT